MFGEAFVFLGVMIAGVAATLVAFGVPVIDAALGVTVSFGVVIIAIWALGIWVDCRMTREEEAFDLKHPGWNVAEVKLEKALLRAIYRWQLQEFGVASKEFSVAVNSSGENLSFHSFRAENDAAIEACKAGSESDLTDSEFEDLRAKRKAVLDRIKPSDAQQIRLEKALQEVVSRQKDPELARLLLSAGQVKMDTRIPLPYGL